MPIKKIIISVLTTIIICLLVFVNATMINVKQLKIREETIKDERNTESLDGFLIAYFSDVNYGEFFDDKQLDKMVDVLNSFSADVIIFGGDLLDEIEKPMSQDERDHLQSALSLINASYGKFAVLGDEDLLSKDKVINILEEADFEILDNRTIQISADPSSYFTLSGLSNSKNGEPDLSILNDIPSNCYSILVSHCPDLFEEVKNYNIDYMLAGHSRGGQIYIPLINYFYRDEGCKKYYRGKKTKNNTTLDISHGVGQNKSNVRLFSDPEIVLYKLKTQ